MKLACTHVKLIHRTFLQLTWYYRIHPPNIHKIRLNIPTSTVVYCRLLRGLRTPPWTTDRDTRCDIIIYNYHISMFCYYNIDLVNIFGFRKIDIESENTLKMGFPSINIFYCRIQWFNVDFSIDLKKRKWRCILLYWPWVCYHIRPLYILYNFCMFKYVILK